MCLGLGRTGSTSLAIALKVLGYEVLHDDEQTEFTEEFESYAKGILSYDELMQILAIEGVNASFKTASSWAVDQPEVKGADA